MKVVIFMAMVLASHAGEGSSSDEDKDKKKGKKIKKFNTLRPVHLKDHEKALDALGGPLPISTGNAASAEAAAFEKDERRTDRVLHHQMNEHLRRQKRQQENKDKKPAFQTSSEANNKAAKLASHLSAEGKSGEGDAAQSGEG